MTNTITHTTGFKIVYEIKSHVTPGTTYLYEGDVVFSSYNDAKRVSETVITGNEDVRVKYIIAIPVVSSFA